MMNSNSDNFIIGYKNKIFPKSHQPLASFHKTKIGLLNISGQNPKLPQVIAQFSFASMPLSAFPLGPRT
jgi:hypothetical protein